MGMSNPSHQWTLIRHFEMRRNYRIGFCFTYWQSPQATVPESGVKNGIASHCPARQPKLRQTRAMVSFGRPKIQPHSLKEPGQPGNPSRRQKTGSKMLPVFIAATSRNLNTTYNIDRLKQRTAACAAARAHQKQDQASRWLNFRQERRVCRIVRYKTQHVKLHPGWAKNQ